MAGKYEQNLSFIKWIDLTVDGLWIFQSPLSVSTISHAFCALQSVSQPQGLLRSLASGHGGHAFPPCPRVTELLPTSTANPSLALPL